MTTGLGQSARVELLERRAYLAAGGLDAAFGEGGTVTTGFTVPQLSTAFDAFTLPDGRVLAVGDVEGNDGEVMVATRFLADGRVDATFGDGGRVLSDAVGTPSDAVRLADGRFLVVGRVNGAAVVARFSADGALDETFGDHGVVRIEGPGAAPLLAVGRKGKVVVASRWSSDAKLRVTRLRGADGAIDPTFGAAGTVVTDQIGVQAILPQADGGVVVGGNFRGGNGVDPDIGLVRLTAAGGLDAAFGTGGIVRRYVFQYGQGVRRIVADGRGGFLVMSSSFVPDVIRFRANGRLDGTFGDGGVRALQAQADDLVVAGPGGGIVAFGESRVGSQPARAVFQRLTAAGDVDFSWGGTGVVRTAVPAVGVGIDRLVVGGDGVLLGVGRVGADAGVVRFNAADGSLDVGYGGDGAASVGATGAGVDGARAMVVQADGKVVVVGESDGQLALVRYRVDGSLDPAFGEGGRVRTEFKVEAADSVRVVAGGKILVGLHDGAARLNADGTVDGTYGLGGRVTIAGDFYLVKPLADGRLIAVRSGGDSGEQTLERFEADGSPDLSFGVGGKLVLVNLTVERPGDILEVSGGRLLVAGRSYPPDSSDENFKVDWGLWRVRADGTLDAAFGVGGKASLNVGGQLYDAPYALAVQADGRVVATGVQYGDGTRFATARWNADGTVDGTFGDAGVVTTVFPPGSGGELGTIPNAATAVVVQADGRIVVAGFHTGPATRTDIDGLAFGDWGVVRYNADGTPDHSFEEDGRRSISFGFYDTAEAAAITADGKLVVAGSAGFNDLGGLAETAGDFAVARFLLDDAGEIGGRVEGGVLKITGGAGADVIRLRVRDGELTVPGMAHTFATTMFSRVEIAGLGGDDVIDASGAGVPVSIDGGDGDDVVLGGRFDDSLVGGGGNDTVFGGRGRDTVRGGGGRDYLNGGAGADAVFGDAGNDQVVAADGAVDTVSGGGGFDRVRGDVEDVLGEVERVLG